MAANIATSKTKMSTTRLLTLGSQRSAARLPPIDRRPLGFALPPHDGFAFVAAPECPRLYTIVLSWSGPAYRPHSHLSQGRQASLYARWLFPEGELLSLRFNCVGGEGCVNLSVSA